MLIYILGVILFALLFEFKPTQVEELTADGKGEKVININQQLSVLTWNIGYGGLGKEMDFFYEGGKMTQPEESLSMLYMQGITNFLKNHDTIDFILLQEVDFDSKRSYAFDQSIQISSALPDYGIISTVNYFSKYVPVPFFNPMGKVKSGLVSYSKYLPIRATRYSTPGKYSFPKRLFMLKRCLLVSRYKTDNKKELIIN